MKRYRKVFHVHALASIFAGMLSAFSGQSLSQNTESSTHSEPSLLSESQPEIPGVEERQRRLADYSGFTNADLALPEAPDSTAFSAQVQSDFQDTLRAYYEYRRKGYEHRQAVFEYQFLTSKVIFIVTLILVFTGIYFAAIQFHERHGRKPQQRGSQPTGDDPTSSTEFVVSFKEIKVRSPVLGVVILTISLAFFYLYLVYVYPIQNVF